MLYAPHQEFTFHYGPIQIKSSILLTSDASRFTFHYGPIQIFLVSECALDLSNLHSTMVLFKFKRICSMFDFDIYLHSTMVLFKLLINLVAIIVNSFTFHYGPIQIRNTLIIHLMLDAFTFHYGPIQIRAIGCSARATLIYIPLWSYSNVILSLLHI